MTTNADSLYPIPTVPTNMRVTPECAADWLENRNISKNRNLSFHIAKRYAETMRAGRWLLTHQGIAFDQEGCMIDGQHRMLAVTMADVPAEFFVIPNCRADTFPALDNGDPRRAAQLLRMRSSTVVASAARYLAVIAEHGMLTGAEKIQGGIYASTIQNDALIAIVARWPELATLTPGITNCSRAASVNAPVHMAVLAQASRTQHGHLIPSWLEGVTHGAELATTDPRLHLRNRFQRDHRVLAINRMGAYNAIVKCWNYYAGGREMRVLKINETEGVLRVAR